MPTIVQADDKKNIDIPAFLEQIRVVNKEAARIFNAHFGIDKSEEA